nr:protein STRUBBELIG-receptor family 2 [Tanacetum cinerariifolium]
RNAWDCQGGQGVRGYNRLGGVILWCFVAAGCGDGIAGFWREWGKEMYSALCFKTYTGNLHSTCVPALAHRNLKVANVLLDEDLTPHICDCRLAVLKPLTINSARVEASKADNGWIVHEYIQPVSGNQRDDIYAFVLVLELLTGK